MIPACFDYQDPADTERGWDNEVTRVDECAHGSHPYECAMCTSSGFIAAVSGEGGHVEINTNLLDEETVMRWLDDQRPTTLKRISYHIEGVAAKRKAEIARESKEWDEFEKPLRRTRKDAGLKREEYKATKGAA